MKLIRYGSTVLIFTAILIAATLCQAQDMRDEQIRAREQLLEQAAAEKQAALEESARSKALIMGDRSQLEQSLRDLEARVASLHLELEKLETEEKSLETEEVELNRQIALTDSMVREMVGVIRVTAKDMATFIDRNLQSAVTEKPMDVLRAIAGQSHFPGMEEIETMVNQLWREIRDAGNVYLTSDTIVDRGGNRNQADILVLGNFTAAYRIGDEVGFLNYSASGHNLFALSKLPPRQMQKELLQYMLGKSDAVPMDISRGGALGQLTHSLSLWQQVPKGGPIVWPILAILGLAIIIVIERVIFLLRKRLDADGLTNRIASLAETGKWEKCVAICARYSGKPVARVVAAGLSCCPGMQRETVENALQEAILKEIPPMERFLSTLGMLAAIAPLLGLLGTVTGMIDTFHVITRHGTGDPRMMSGGISEALVTTMLGLTVAIPIMLAHTLLNRAVDKRIGQMEEKAVALVNIVQKNDDISN